jgi:hypothetical protein
MATLPLSVPGREPNAAQVFRYPQGYALAYRIRARTLVDGEPARSWDYLADAHSGALLARLPLEEEERAPARGVGRTLYSGTVALDTTRVTEPSGESFLLVDSTRPATGLGGPFGGNAVVDLAYLDPPNPDGWTTAAPYVQGQNTWGDGQAEAPLAPQHQDSSATVAADAAYGLQCTWDYFLRIHRRSGWDGRGTATLALVHPRPGIVDDNAVWSKRDHLLVVGNPNQLWPVSTLATLAHEFAHGVTEATANLVYQGESGGLNEATSDIFSVLVRAFVANGSGTAVGDRNVDWNFTATYPTSTGGHQTAVVRDMIRPSNDGRSPDAWNVRLAGLDPHQASGPMNRAFYFLSQGATTDPRLDTTSPYLPGGMTGIGNDKAARIWYHALSTQLTSGSTYLDARAAALKAAIELYGQGSPENLAVHRAFAAIHVGDAAAPPDDFMAPLVTADLAAAGGKLTLTALAEDNDQVAAVAYLIDGIPVGQASTSPYTLVLDTRRLLANGTHTLVALALDRSGNQGASTSWTFETLNPTQQLIRDPGLELQGPASPWGGRATVSSAVDRSGAAPHGGDQYGLFATTSNVTNQVLGQAVTIPAGVASATLRFWTLITGDASVPPTGSFQVTATPQAVTGGPADGDPASLAFTREDAWPGWILRELDLTPFAGWTVQVQFQRDRVEPGVEYRVDDITLVCGARPVTVTVDPPRLALVPGTQSGAVRAAVAGSDDQTVAWTVREGDAGGRFDPGQGIYTAPSRPGIYHLVATSRADPLASAELSIQVLPQLTLSPATAFVDPGGTATFALGLGAEVQLPLVYLLEGPAAGSWFMAPGSTTGAYTAPQATGTYHLVAVDLLDPTQTRYAVATITVTAPSNVTLWPRSLTLPVGATYPLEARTSDGSPVYLALDEGPAGGSLSSAYVDPDRQEAIYAAPATPGVYHLTATSLGNPSRRAAGTVTVRDGMVVFPARKAIRPGTFAVLRAMLPYEDAFNLSEPVVWSVQPQAELETHQNEAYFFAPDTPGTYVVTATTAGEPVLTASATLDVTAPDPDRNGRASGDFGDLAAIADAYGAIAAPGQTLAGDLNEDGVVDDEDLAEAMRVFEQFH